MADLFRCCQCGCAFDARHPLCPHCGRDAVVTMDSWDGLTSEDKQLIDDLRQGYFRLHQMATKYRDALVDVGNCHNLATMREVARRALS